MASDFQVTSTIRPLAFQLTLVPGTTRVQSATATYEVVLPSGRAVPLQASLDLTLVQGVVDQCAGIISEQLLLGEQLYALWPAVSIVVFESAKVAESQAVA